MGMRKTKTVRKKTEKKKKASTKMLATITDYCDNVLAFIQAVAGK